MLGHCSKTALQSLWDLILALRLQDPHLGGNTLEEAEARKKHALERAQQASKQAALDQEQRIETRWPYVSPCGKVRAGSATCCACMRIVLVCTDDVAMT